MLSQCVLSEGIAPCDRCLRMRVECGLRKGQIRVTAAQVIVAANNTIATWDRKTDFLPDLLSLHPTSQIDEIKINELDHIGTAEIDIKRPPITHDTPEDIATSRELTPVGSEFSYLMGFSPAPSIRSQPHLPEPEKLGLSRKDSGLRRSEPPRSVSPTPPPSPYHLSRDKLSSIIASLRDRDGFLQPIAVPLKPPLPFPMTSRSEIVQTGNS